MGIQQKMKWLDVLTVEFTAFAYPFWQEKTPKTLTLSSGASGVAYSMSAMETEAEAVITANAAMTGFELSCGETTFTLSDLNVASGSTVVISYTDKDHILQIKSGTTSLLDKRSAESSDDLILAPGGNAVAFTSTGAASCEIRWKGVYV